MIGHGEKLTRSMEQAIVALLACSSIRDAAQACEVGEATLRRWLRLEVFQSAYREARRQCMQQAIVQVQQATGDAVATLCSVMKDSGAPASAKVSAAKIILETAVKAVELEDLEVRLVALERQFSQGATS